MFIPFLTILERRRGGNYEGRKENKLTQLWFINSTTLNNQTQQLWTTKLNNFEQPKSNYDNLYI